MKNTNLLKLATVICVVALLACALGILFKTVHFGIRYANAEQYTAGGAELTGAVKNLDIHWTSGAVNVAYHDGDTVLISETAKKAISGDAELRWWLDGDTLRVQYAKSGYFSFHSPDKVLTVTLPEGLALGNVDIDLTSGDVSVPDLRADAVAIGVTSGDVALKQSGESESVVLSGTSGHIDADVEKAGKLSVSVTSGAIRTTFTEADEVDLSITSGDITMTGGSARKARIDTTSGKIGVRLAAFDALKIDATSGDITAALPSTPGYRAEIDTTSGRFDYAVALSRDGDAYTCGDGSGRVEIHSTSGDVRLEEVEK